MLKEAKTNAGSSNFLCMIVMHRWIYKMDRFLVGVSCDGFPPPPLVASPRQFLLNVFRKRTSRTIPSKCETRNVVFLETLSDINVNSATKSKFNSICYSVVNDGIVCKCDEVALNESSKDLPPKQNAIRSRDERFEKSMIKDGTEAPLR